MKKKKTPTRAGKADVDQTPASQSVDFATLEETPSTTNVPDGDTLAVAASYQTAPAQAAAPMHTGYYLPPPPDLDGRTTQMR